MLAIILAPFYLLINYYVVRWMIRWTGTCHRHLKSRPFRAVFLCIYIFMCLTPLTSYLVSANPWHSYLKRLEEKGFLSCKKAGKVNTYTAMVAREDYQRSEGESFLKKLYGSSISRFAAALYDGKRVEPAELEELQALLDRLSGGEET